MHSIKIRPLTDQERQQLGSGQQDSITSLGCFAIFFGIVPAFLLGQLGAVLAKHVEGRPIAFGRGIGWVLGAGLFAWALAKFLPFIRVPRERQREDAARKVVEEIEVTQARVFELEPVVEGRDPVLAFDLGERKILLLQGQWLRDPAVYGADRARGDASENFLNGLEAPCSFPSGAFTLLRLPASGRVIGIRVQGEYLAPSRKIAALEPDYILGDSELFEGALEDVGGILAQSHRQGR